VVAYSATGSAMEYINYDAPPAGTWWILVQNWEGSDAQPDRVLMAVGVVPAADSGNLTVSGPASIPSGQPFDLDVNWDESSMMGFDRWYGAFSLGTDAANPDNLGLVKVDLYFLGAMVTKSAPETAVSGSTFTYAITLDTPGPISGTAVISDVLPAGISIITDTITSTFGTARYDAATNAVYWSNAPIMRRPVSLVADSLAPAATDGVAVELVLDDGTNENNIGIGGTDAFIFANYFSPAPGLFPLELDEVQVYFEGGTTGVQVGDDIVIAFYKDDDGNPGNGADYLVGYPATVQAVDAWNTYALSTTVPFDSPTNIFIGVIAMEIPGTSYFPAALDTTASQGRSWAGWWNTSPPPDPPTLPPDDTWMLIDDFIPGNWLVRGYGESLVPDTVSITFDVTVTASAGDVITNTADMVYNAGVPDAASAVTTIVAYGVEIAPPTAAMTSAPGTVVTYTLTVTNTGTAADTFDLVATGNNWTSAVTTPVGPLAAGASGTTYVAVSIPANAADGDSDTVTITATSQGDNTKTDTSVLTTTAKIAGYNIFLPLIMK
jgi:uncharacterized repeat protein (TIGR01451 family)